MFAARHPQARRKQAYRRAPADAHLRRLRQALACARQGWNARGHDGLTRDLIEATPPLRADRTSRLRTSPVPRERIHAASCDQRTEAAPEKRRPGHADGREQEQDPSDDDAANGKNPSLGGKAGNPRASHATSTRPTAVKKIPSIQSASPSSQSGYLRLRADVGENGPWLNRAIFGVKLRCGTCWRRHRAARARSHRRSSSRRGPCARRRRHLRRHPRHRVRAARRAARLSRAR